MNQSIPADRIEGVARLPVRVIPKIELKGDHVVKGIRMEGLRRVGKPYELARAYAAAGADEIFFVDTVASLYGRNNVLPLVSEVSREINLPLTVGGGVRSLEDFREILRAGADKVAINTHAINRPEFITEAAEVFGSQSVVLSLQCKARAGGGWEAYTLNGRERSGRDAVDWAVEAVERGAGEVLVTSIDRDGTRRGPDLALAEAVAAQVVAPVQVGGGISAPEDCAALAARGASAVVIAHMLHFERMSLTDARKALVAAGREVRPLARSGAMK